MLYLSKNNQLHGVTSKRLGSIFLKGSGGYHASQGDHVTRQMSVGVSKEDCNKRVSDVKCVLSVKYHVQFRYCMLRNMSVSEKL